MCFRINYTTVGVVYRLAAKSAYCDNAQLSEPCSCWPGAAGVGSDQTDRHTHRQTHDDSINRVAVDMKYHIHIHIHIHRCLSCVDAVSYTHLTLPTILRV